jgi:hypothetical protein
MSDSEARASTTNPSPDVDGVANEANVGTFSNDESMASAMADNERRFHNAKNARKAAFSKRSSPVSRESVANSSINEPAPAVQVSCVSPRGTPFLRLT